MKWYFWRFITKLFILWLSLMVATDVLASSIINFERKSNMDIFENNNGQDKCFTMNASFHKINWCECNNEEIFVGDICIPQIQLSGKLQYTPV